MTWAVVAEAVTLVVALALLHLAHRERRSAQRLHDRRVDTLLDRLAHAEGRPWMPAPVEDGQPEEQADVTYMFAPEQEPDE